MGEKREKASSEKRRMILDAAFKLFEEKGYEKTKIIDIAEAAGIGKGTVYEYFPGKTEIAGVWIGEHFVAHKERIEKIAADSEKTASEKVKALIESDSRLVSDFLEHLELVSQIVKDKPPLPQGDLLIEVIGKIEEIFGIITGIIEEGMESGEFRKADPRKTAITVIGSAAFYTTMPLRMLHIDEDYRKSLYIKENIKKELAGDELLDILFNGIKA